VAKQQPERRFTLLYDKVCRQDILQEARQRMKSNKGAAGVDEVAIDEIREYHEARFLGEIAQELRDGSYRASLVRRVQIPKTRTAGENPAVGHPGDRLVRMEQGFTILFSPDEAHGQSAAQFAASPAGIEPATC
jgi:RNA-directed DNA polymerase